ncbi:MAG: flagellar biosynthetic protein FliR [Planctomycetota bacterium]
MDRSAELMTSLGMQSDWSCLFVAVFCRVAPVLFMMPGVGSLVLPVRMRIAFAIVLTLLLVPVAKGEAAPELASFAMESLPVFGGELLLGLMLGIIFSLTVVSLQFAGRIVSQLAGFDFAQSTSADGEETQPLLAGTFGWLALAIVFACGGHRLMLDACLGSFAHSPLGSFGMNATGIETLVNTLQHSCEVGIRAALPVSFALLVANLVNGIVARAVPQMNLFALGFSVNALTLLAALALSVGGVGWIFQQEIGGWIDQVHHVASVDP